MDALQPATPARPVVEVSIARLATALFSGLALMFSFGALIVASHNHGATKVAQGGTVKPATTAVLDQSAVPSGAVAVSLAEFSFTPKMVMVEKGGALKVTDAGATQHTLSVEGRDLATPTLNPKDTVALSLGALEPGAYTISCTIPGHKAAGMTGELHILAAGQTVAAGTVAPTNADAMDATMAARTKAFPAPTAGLGGQLLPATVLADGTKEFDLTTRIVDWEIEPGKIVQAWTYNGVVPGPTLKVEVGDRVKVVIKNELPESTSIHFHGLRVPNAMDGVPDITQAPIKPGASFTYEFTAQGPMVGMYHSHQDALTQVTNGLAGAFLVGQEPLPQDVKISQELPMMLNDSGTIGLSLNGKSFPATAPLVVHTGDYVLVHADAPGVWAWHCHILPHAEGPDGMFGMVTAMIVK